MATCVNEEGYKKAEQARADAMRPVLIAKGVFNSYLILDALGDAMSSYKKMNAIADETLAIEERDFAHNRDVFWKAENQFFDEFYKAEPWEDEVTLARRYEGRLWPPIANTFAKKINELRCSKPRYCTNAYIRAMQELEVTMAATKTAVKTLAGQLAFAEVNGIDERNFDRRKTAYGLYKGLVAQAAGYYSASSNGFAGVNADAMAQFGGAVNDTMFMLNRRGNEAQANEFHALTAAGAMQQGAAGAPPGAANAQRMAAENSADLSMAESFATGATGRNSVANFKGATSSDANGNNSRFLGPGAFANQLAAGTGSDMARTGKITITHPGKRYNVVGGEGGRVYTDDWSVTIDLDKLPLADVSAYESPYQQSGPDTLPGSSERDVVYKLPEVK